MMQSGQLANMIVLYIWEKYSEQSKNICMPTIHVYIGDAANLPQSAIDNYGKFRHFREARHRSKAIITSRTCQRTRNDHFA